MRTVLAAGLCLCLFQPALAQTAGQPREKTEPSYQGRPLNSWMGALREKTKDENHALRKRAVAGLTAIGEPAIPALVRRGGAEALGLMGQDAKAAVPALLRALKATDDGVRDEAGEALRKIDSAPADKAGVS